MAKTKKDGTFIAARRRKTKARIGAVSCCQNAGCSHDLNYVTCGYSYSRTSFGRYNGAYDQGVSFLAAVQALVINPEPQPYSPFLFLFPAWRFSRLMRLPWFGNRVRQSNLRIRDVRLLAGHGYVFSWTKSWLRVLMTDCPGAIARVRESVSRLQRQHPRRRFVDAENAPVRPQDTHTKLRSLSLSVGSLESLYNDNHHKKAWNISKRCIRFGMRLHVELFCKEL